MAQFIQFGPWHPDLDAHNSPIMIRAENCQPAPSGYHPIPKFVPVATPVPERVFGSRVFIDQTGGYHSFCGTSTSLYKFNDATFVWDDVSGPSGPYATTTYSGWDFDIFGNRVIATNFADPVQKYDLESDTTFVDLGGSPPQARFVEIVQDQVVLACINDTLAGSRVAWSGIANSEQWTPGTNSAGFTDLSTGGPITGLIGGEVGYPLQRGRISRMQFVPGSTYVYQFDEMESGRGVVAPRSIVRLGKMGFAQGDNGFYRIDLSTGSSQPLGINKWREWVQNDIRQGAELFTVGAIGVNNTAVAWAYVSVESNDTTLPDKILFYDWTLDEATIVKQQIQDIAAWVSPGYHLDNINSFGPLDDLFVSLDSPFWRGGAPLVGVFDQNGQLGHLSGPNMEALFETQTAERDERRTILTGIRPHIETANLHINISTTESDGVPPTYSPTDWRMEDSGVVSIWESGHSMSARIIVEEGAGWKLFHGMESMIKDGGGRR